MYYGDNSEDLNKARNEYHDIFGYDPNGEMELEFSDHDEYLSILHQCIEEEKDIFEVLGE